MPLYEYECAECHRRTEKIQKFSDAELTTCPYCGGALARTLTAPAIQFKGSGWYKDLYSSPKPTASNPEASSGTAPPGTASSAEPASAPAAASGTPAATAPATSSPSGPSSS